MKNKSAVHMGRLSAKARLKSLGVKGLSQKMKEVRAAREAKKVVHS